MGILRKIYLIVAAVLLLLVVFLLLNSYTAILTRPGDYEARVDSSRVVKVEKPIMKYGMRINGMEVREGYVKSNQLFTELLAGCFISSQVQLQLQVLPRSVFDFRKIVSKRKYTLILKSDSINSAVAFVYEPSPIEFVVFHLHDSLTVETFHREIKTEEKAVSGTITASLYETIEGLDISHELTNKFVDVFGWQVDFQHLQKGDRFKLIYEENTADGQSIGIGKILGIYFEHFTNGYYAFPFDQGEGIDYFDEEGNSLRKALLKYPIEFTRISSRYSLNRFHPVVKVFRAHLGTDFAAATGTPIRTVGDGVVLEAQYTANNGNYVKVRHNGTYTTGYLHMSKIASGVVAGARVKQ
ncbi:MAG TPA: peptidoglycan DD-metalloendopeptidase family protein, partial [Cyclobacteriaceae bacterium]|nr:peptidoglycan DD-metalloendopeptidase family protein [Cyclobacteriaceae bacterium]